jgi:hypothetical protein
MPDRIQLDPPTETHELVAINATGFTDLWVAKPVVLSMFVAAAC